MGQGSVCRQTDDDRQRAGAGFRDPRAPGAVGAHLRGPYCRPRALPGRTRLGRQTGGPLYGTLCHIPLFIWHPEGAHNGGRIDAITQTVDLYATALELLGLAAPEQESIHSRSLVPLLLGETSVHRDHAVYGYCGERVGISTGEWTLLRDHDPARGSAYWYSSHTDQLYERSFAMRYERPERPAPPEAGSWLPGAQSPVWRLKALERALRPPREDLLFHAPSDHAQEHNLAARHPEQLAELEGRLREHMQRLAAPEAQLRRLRL